MGENAERWGKEKQEKKTVRFGEGYNRLNYYKDSAFSVCIGDQEKMMNGDEIVEMVAKRSGYMNTMYNSLNRAIAIRYARDLGISNKADELVRFKILQEELLKSRERSKLINYPASYELYTDELADQELCLLKLQLWYADASGLIGSTGAVIDAVIAGMVEIHKPADKSERKKSEHEIELLSSFVDSLDEYGPDLIRRIYRYNEIGES